MWEDEFISLFLLKFCGDDMAAEEIQINVNKKGTVSISYKQNSTFFNSQ